MTIFLIFLIIYIMTEINSILTMKDKIMNILVRFGINRYAHRVNPGLYNLNNAGPDSPVLVSANYRLTYDLLRQNLKRISCYLLILDTKGINVWCAAGKGTFGTAELIHRISETRLAEHVGHKRLILPQLGAPGIEAHIVSRKTKFKIIYGPVESRDIPAFLDSGMKKTDEMKYKRFPISERLVLTGVELVQSWKIILPILALLVIFTGFGFGWSKISFTHTVLPAILVILSGALFAPALLPVLPFRAFAAKGAVTGLVMSALWAVVVRPQISFLVLASGLIIASSSFLMMNFTGSSTYTSLSGVKKEMKYALPLQIMTVGVALAAGIILRIVKGGTF